MAVKYSIYLWVALAFTAAGYFAIQQEILERQYPTPHEWRFLTRTRYKSACAERDRKDEALPSWLQIMQIIQQAIERLEDPNGDGKGVVNGPAGGPPGTKDISAMSEPWRRGYFEAMMVYAAAAERLDGWVLDKTRKLYFPPEVVIGPSNPKPKPIAFGGKSAPLERDCEAACATPDDIYMKLIMTVGITDRQRMDASLAYATWLDHKGIVGAASVMYERALEGALASRPANTPNPVDDKTWTLKESAGLPTANVLKTLTALATFQARAGNVSVALPILVSILKARRSLPNADVSVLPPTQTSKKSNTGTFASPSELVRQMLGLLQPPEYPPPPEDGNSVPTRGPLEKCEEAALHLYIGEIIYSSRASNREEGLAWTREAVDMAEEQLRMLDTTSDAARTTCRECLATGLSNWGAMVALLAKEEDVRRQASLSPNNTSGTGNWFGLWSASKPEDLDRWAAEGRVLEERTRRVAELLEDLQNPSTGLGSIFSA
jgi:hypothetical protein